MVFRVCVSSVRFIGQEPDCPFSHLTRTHMAVHSFHAQPDTSGVTTALKKRGCTDPTTKKQQLLFDPRPSLLDEFASGSTKQ